MYAIRSYYVQAADLAYLGIIAPQFLARARIDRVNDAQPGGEIEHVAHFDRLGHGCRLRQVYGPREPKLRGIVPVYRLERAEMLLAVCPAVSGPVVAARAIGQRCFGRRICRDVASS